MTKKIKLETARQQIFCPDIKTCIISTRVLGDNSVARETFEVQKHNDAALIQRKSILW